VFVIFVAADEYADETCAIDAVEDIESTARGYQLKIQLPSVFFKYIIGKKGETKKRLESETRTQIRIPRQHEEGDIGMYRVLCFVRYFYVFCVTIHAVIGTARGSSS